MNTFYVAAYTLSRIHWWYSVGMFDTIDKCKNKVHSKLGLIIEPEWKEHTNDKDEFTYAEALIHGIDEQIYIARIKVVQF